MQDYEKLGAFYLGRLYDEQQGKPTDDLLLYDAKDLTTHAVCVGMTGSGKTGLCLALLEEAAIDGIPAIAIDPKGDLGNLMLTFPELRPENFRPWIDESEAARKGLTPDAYAADRARLWREGLAQWAQDGTRIARFREAADVAIYTPGSNAGLPLMVLRSLAAPPADLVADADAMRERVSAMVSGLLALLGIDVDPVQSREHILLSSVLDRAWRAGRNLDIAALIHQIQSPPFDKMGVMDLESFFPAKDRFKLAMSLNSLLASPGFAAWMEGEPLEIPRLLHTALGKPRISILSIAHLSDAERMFFVTLLLNEIIGWMRLQPGTGSLRAVLYMDEIFGYFPPTANPPAKTPMLTLLKQARAYGLGVVLATQNPVDLDYKGLANTGTWFIGRLQTERDKARLLDGLQGAAAGSAFDRGRMESLLSGLGSRVFLMNNVHEDAPVLFHTRWTLSYLRGPLTRSQIQDLTASRKEAVAAAPPAPAPAAPTPPTAAAAPVADSALTTTPPPLPPGITQGYLAVTRSTPAGAYIRYEPSLVGVGKVHWESKPAGVDEWKDVALCVALDDQVSLDPWSDAGPISGTSPDVESHAAPGGRFAALPPLAAREASYAEWSKAFANHLYQNHAATLLKASELKQFSKPNESEADFRGRLRHLLHEKRDAQIEALRKRYAPKLAAIEDRIRRAEERVDREKSQVRQHGLQTAISFGTTILGALFGRKKASVGNVGRAASALRSAGRTARERGDVSRAEENVDTLKQQLLDLNAEFESEVAQIQSSADVESLAMEEVTLRPKKSDITVASCALIWRPYVVTRDGRAEPAHDL